MSPLQFQLNAVRDLLQHNNADIAADNKWIVYVILDNNRLLSPFALTTQLIFSKNISMFLVLLWVVNP